MWSFSQLITKREEFHYFPLVRRQHLPERGKAEFWAMTSSASLTQFYQIIYFFFFQNPFFFLFFPTFCWKFFQFPSLPNRKDNLFILLFHLLFSAFLNLVSFPKIIFFSQISFQLFFISSKSIFNKKNIFSFPQIHRILSRFCSEMYSSFQTSDVVQKL